MTLMDKAVANFPDAPALNVEEKVRLLHDSFNM